MEDVDWMGFDKADNRDENAGATDVKLPTSAGKECFRILN